MNVTIKPLHAHAVNGDPLPQAGKRGIIIQTPKPSVITGAGAEAKKNQEILPC